MLQSPVPVPKPTVMGSGSGWAGAGVASGGTAWIPSALGTGAMENPVEQVGGQSTTPLLEALPTASMSVRGGRPRGCCGHIEEGKTVTLVELQGGEDGAERRRQGCALGTGAHVSVRS